MQKVFEGVAMKKVFEVDEACPSCNGTGLFVGLAERGGAAVVCWKCNGTGCFHFKHHYDDFSGRSKVNARMIRRVYQTNPGFVINDDPKYGGLSLADWEAGKPFGPGTENRELVCPKWWYQSAAYDKGPNWDECIQTLGRRFSDCSCFATKATCWARYDKEFNRG